MRSPRRFVLASSLCAALIAVILAAGCGDDDGSSPKVFTLADFEGSWEAVSYKISSAAAPAIFVEIISLGATFEWNLDDSGNFTGSAFVPASVAGQDLNLSFQGTVQLVGQDSVYVTFDPEVPPFLTETRGEFELVGDTLTMRDENSTFDFGLGGGEEVAIFEGTFTRN